MAVDDSTPQNMRSINLCCSLHGMSTCLHARVPVNAGMGCSSSIVAIDLVKHLFNSIPNTLALIVNHENISSQSYIGEQH